MQPKRLLLALHGIEEFQVCLGLFHAVDEEFHGADFIAAVPLCDAIQDRVSVGVVQRLGIEDGEASRLSSKNYHLVITGQVRWRSQPWMA